MTGHIGHRGTVLPVALAAAFTAASLDWLPGPFVWIGFAWSVTLVVVAVRCTGRHLQGIALVLASVSLGLAMAEIGLGALRAPPGWPTYSEPYQVRGEDMWVPVPGAASRSTRLRGKQVLFDVVYTIGADGLRLAPPVVGPPPRPVIAFFGCSFTYGEGVADQEALPYQVGQRTEHRWRTLNLAYHGYGPHQMLRLLEQGRLDELAGTDHVRHVVYGMIPQHVERVVGGVPWGKHAPQYVLDRYGAPRFIGRFEDTEIPSSAVTGWLVAQIGKSALYRLIHTIASTSNADDIRLLAAVVRMSRDVVTRDYPEAEFHVLMWPTPGGLGVKLIERRIREALEREGIVVHELRLYFPEIEQDPARYYIPYDLHPSAEAHSYAARYVVESILRTKR